MIQSCTEGETYPIKVRVKDGHLLTYTLDGRLLITNACQTLFWDEVVIEAPEKPLPDLEVDAKVIVWDNGRDRFSRHFSHFSKDGVLHTFSHGKTSFTGAGHTTPWDNWELAE